MKSEDHFAYTQENPLSNFEEDNELENSCGTDKTEQHYLEDKIPQLQAQKVNQFEDSLIGDLDMPKKVSAPRASAQRYEPPLEDLEDDRHSAPRLYAKKKEDFNISSTDNKSSTHSSEQTTIVQIVSNEKLCQMTELDKEMYRRQLNNEIQRLIKKDMKLKSNQEEVELLQRNLKLEQDLHDSEFQNRKLQLWILDDKYHELKKVIKEEHAQNQKMDEMLKDLQQNIDLVANQVKEQDELIQKEKEVLRGHRDEHDKIETKLNLIQVEVSQSQDIRDKENEKLKFEESIKDENKKKLSEIEDQIKQAEKRLDKETDRKQKMFIQMKNNERDMVNIAKETQQFNEMIEDKEEIQDMLEAQQIFLKKQNNILQKEVKKVQKKVDSVEQFISYGLKNNKVWQDQIDEDQAVVDKIRLEKSRMNNELEMAKSSIEQLESQIEMTEKKIKLIEQSSATLEKTALQRQVALENGNKLGKSMLEEQPEETEKESVMQMSQQRSRSALEMNKTVNQSQMSKCIDKENDDNLDSPDKFEKSYVSQTVKMSNSRKSVLQNSKQENIPKQSISPISRNDQMNNVSYEKDVRKTNFSKFLDQHSPEKMSKSFVEIIEDEQQRVRRQNVVVNRVQTVQQNYASSEREEPKPIFKTRSTSSNSNQFTYSSRNRLNQNKSFSGVPIISKPIRETERSKERAMIQKQNREFLEKVKEKRQTSNGNHNYQVSSFHHEQQQQPEPLTEPQQPKRMEQFNEPPPRSHYSKFLAGEPPKFTESQMYRAQNERETDQETIRSNNSKSGRKKSHMINDILKQKKKDDYKDYQWQSRKEQPKTTFEYQRGNYLPPSQRQPQYPFKQDFAEPAAEDKCSLIDLSSHSLRNFNELQKIQKHFESGKMDHQSDYINQRNLCDDSSISICRELDNYDRVTEEGHKDFMAKYSSKKYENDGLKSRFAQKQGIEKTPMDQYLNQSINEKR